MKPFAAMRHGATVLATLENWNRTVAPRDSLGRERIERRIKDKEDKENEGQRQEKSQRRRQAFADCLCLGFTTMITKIMK